MRFPVRPWLLLLLLASYSDYTIGQCLEDQKVLLLQLKDNISFSGLLPSLPSWNLNTDCCVSWAGVDCDKNGYVIGVDLSSKFISGGLESSSSLFKLKYLRRLNLSYNNFNSSLIPSGLEQLANLTHLNLSNSGFAGQVPLAIARMTRLVSLDLSTLFAGLEPLKLENPNLGTLVRDLVELRELYLDGVNISMHGIEWCQALSSSVPSLSVLSLSNCYLSGPLDSSLLKLRSLSTLRLGENSLFASLPDFIGNFSSLSLLDIGSCALTGTLPENIFQLPLLRILDVSDNHLLRGSLPEFPQSSSLENLVLSRTNFSGNLPESIGNLRLLTRLDLTSCGFSGLLPASISNLTQLHYIDLSINKFTGALPLFGIAENLTHVNLAHNRLTGSISSSLWGRHLRLVNLNLRNNLLNGSIPSSLFTLPSLQKLDLSQNQFNGRLSEVPNGSLLMLDTLDFSNNLLEGSIPMSIFDISSLKIITLSSNNFSGTVWLDRFQTLRNLSSLDLSGNNVWINSTGIDSALFPQVGTLKLASCNLRTFPEFLSNQSTLSYLDLSNNQIGGRIPNWLPKIGKGNLVYLNLSVNFLESPGEPFLGDQFISLAVVDMHSNSLDGQIPILPPMASVLDYSNNKISSIPTATTRNSSSLQVTIFFSLSNNSLTGEIPSSLCKAEYLQVLDLSDNDLTGSIPICLSNISSLRVLNLRNNKLNGTVPEVYPRGCNLRTLDLNANMLEGEVSKSLANCTMLEVLDLGNNQISGSFPRGLGALPNLRVLVLRNNKFVDSIRYRLEDVNSTFQRLQIIDISSNYFTGKLPAEIFLRLSAMMNEDEAESNHKHSILKFGFLELSHLYYQDAVTVTSKGQQMELVKILTIFTSIDLSNNRFEGEIPDAIGNLSALYVLNLSSNALTGSIPTSLGNLRQLESLDLSGNKLTGHIPSDLEDLTFLSALNLSFNQLVGTIPQDRQFQTFNQNAFEGNNGLCGPPLSTSCTNTSRLSPSPSAHDDSKPTVEFNWQFIITGLGFGGGTAVIVAPLWFWAEGRKWYDRQFTRLLLIIVSSTTLLYNSRVDPVSESSSMEQERTNEDFMDDYSDEEDDTGGVRRRSGRYCVFCTKLDSSMKRVVHNPKCSCQTSEFIAETFMSV